MTSLNDIYNTEENPLKVEIYEVQVKVDDSVKHWKCNPMDSISTLLEKNKIDFRTVMVTFNNEEISDNDPTPLCVLFSSKGCQSIIITPFCVTAKIDNNKHQWRYCNKYDTLGKFLNDNQIDTSKCLVKIGDVTMSEYDQPNLHFISEPISIFFTVTIIITFEDDSELEKR